MLTDVDHWVKVFYDDLCVAVKKLARPNTGLDIGFIDYQLPPGSDWKGALAGALGAAEVFIPLYSPGYLTRSWPLSERESFGRRISASTSKEAERHVIPVLWIPLPSPGEVPELTLALELGEGIPEYAVNGMRALRALSSYAERYATILRRLARRIVDLAERSPLGPSPAPVPGESTGRIPTDTRFVIAVLAPTVTDLPTDRQAGAYGLRSAQWRPFVDTQALPIAEYAANVAERLGLPTQIVDFTTDGALLEERPGVLLIDPWIVAGQGGEARLSAAFEQLHEWVTPLVVVNQSDPQYAEGGAALSTRTTDMLMRAGAHRVRRAREVDEFVQLMPALVSETRRQYLRNAAVFPPKGPDSERPRLRPRSVDVPPAGEEDHD
jgi:FxsC-like protein